MILTTIVFLPLLIHSGSTRLLIRTIFVLPHFAVFSWLICLVWNYNIFHRFWHACYIVVSERIIRGNNFTVVVLGWSVLSHQILLLYGCRRYLLTRLVSIIMIIIIVIGGQSHYFLLIHDRRWRCTPPTSSAALHLMSCWNVMIGPREEIKRNSKLNSKVFIRFSCHVN